MLINHCGTTMQLVAIHMFRRRFVVAVVTLRVFVGNFLGSGCETTHRSLSLSHFKVMDLGLNLMDYGEGEDFGQ